MKHKKYLLIIAMAFVWLTLPFATQAQVKIGDNSLPTAGAILDLKTTSGGAYLGGLLLPNVSIIDLGYIPESFTDYASITDEGTEIAGKGKDKASNLIGLVVYNTNEDIGVGTYVWDGDDWLTFGDVILPQGEIGYFGTSSLNGTNVTQGQSVSESGTLQYFAKTGDIIKLTNGQVLGEKDGLQIVADGAQSLSDPTGTVNIKLVGTPTTTGTINIPVSLNGAETTISVTSNTAVGVIGTLGTCTLDGSSVIAGAGVSMSGTIPYSGKTGGNIVLTDGEELGAAANGMKIVADGDQNLSNASGSIKVKLVGTPTGSGNATVSYEVGGASGSVSVNVIANITSLPAGDAIFSGITCYDIAETSYGNTECGVFATRLNSKHNFATNHALAYTFRPNVNVTGVRFTAVNNSAISVVENLTNQNPGNINANATYTLTVNFNRNLNVQAKGLSGAAAPTATLYVIFTYNGTQYQKSVTVTVQDCACCGAMIDNGKWLTFACHNLGADISLDPMNLNYDGGKSLYGAKYKFGNKTPALTMAQDQASSAAVSGWSNTSTYQTSGDWIKANDPCTHELGGSWRLPTQSEWAQVTKMQNNTISYLGTWTGTTGTEEYAFGLKIGDRLFLPAAGWRHNDNGHLHVQGIYGYYWSSTQSGGNGYYLDIENGFATSTNFAARTSGMSVRCVAD